MKEDPHKDLFSRLTFLKCLSVCLSGNSGKIHDSGIDGFKNRMGGRFSEKSILILFLPLENAFAFMNCSVNLASVY